jgi:hypothetical protein
LTPCGTPRSCLPKMSENTKAGMIKVAGGAAVQAHYR